MTVITATYRIVTPMFLGDADQRATSLRPPSVKGALRFWWRALSWGRCLDQARSVSDALKLLHRDEAYLFGSAADEASSGQSRFLLDVQYAGAPVESSRLPCAGPGHQYLLGQGLYHFNRGYLRSALEPGELRLRLLFRARTESRHIASVARALLVLGLLGGLGSRGRKGFGSLAIQSLEGIDLQVPGNTNELREALARLVADRPNGLPPYTAFSMQSRIDAVSDGGQDVWKLLGEVGGEMQRYRSWGRNGQVSGQPAEQNFSEDHDLTRDAAQGKPVPTHPQRVVFGLPHNYFFSSLNAPDNKLDVNAMYRKSDGKWTDIGANRRASPLFIHIHEFLDGDRAGILALLPAQFLPKDWQIGMKKAGQPACGFEPDPDWTVLHEFMDRFADRSALLEAQQ